MCIDRDGDYKVSPSGFAWKVFIRQGNELFSPCYSNKRLLIGRWLRSFDFRKFKPANPGWHFFKTKREARRWWLFDPLDGDVVRKVKYRKLRRVGYEGSDENSSRVFTADEILILPEKGTK